MSPYPLAFHNVFYELNHSDIVYLISNPMEYPVTVKVISEYQGLSYPSVKTETIMPGDTEMIDHTLQIKDGESEQIKTKTKVNAHCRMEYNENGEWKLWEEDTTMIEVYPRDTMVWALKDEDGEYVPLHRLIAVFVTPNAGEVQELLSIAKEYHPQRRLSGYQDEVFPQIKAIYDALQDHYGISYISSSVAFGKEDVQKVRLPKESLGLSSANCIDGTVLFASAIEALGMESYIVIIPGHAFVACYDKNENITYALETTMIGGIKEDAGWRLEYETSEFIKDGYKASWQLAPGNYTFQITSDVGVTPAISSGGSYIYETDTSYLRWSKEISVPSNGVFEIANPSIFGLGESANVTIKIYEFHQKEYYSCEDAVNRGSEELIENANILIDEDYWNGCIVPIKFVRDLGILPME